jgi:hypothetical protein
LQINLRAASLLGPVIFILASLSAFVLFWKSQLYTLGQLMVRTQM